MGDDGLDDVDRDLLKLMVGLRTATGLYVRGRNPKADGDGGVGGAMHAVYSLREFCKNIGVPTHDLLPLTELLRAFHDLSDGKEPGLFARRDEAVEPRKKPKLSINEREKRRIVSLAIDALMSSGNYSKEEACRYVARKLLNSGANLHRKTTSKAEPWETVAYWRDYAKSESPRAYQESFLRLSVIGDSYEKMADELLARLPLLFDLKI